MNKIQNKDIVIVQRGTSTHLNVIITARAKSRLANLRNTQRREALPEIGRRKN